jgi:hypothetical protein
MTGDINLVCLVCGGTFLAPKPRRGRYRRFCSSACRLARRASQHLAYRAEGRYPAPVRRLRQKVCAICGESFSTKDPRTECCSSACGIVLSHRRSSATRKQRSDEKHAAVCQQCGVGFVARNPSGKARRGLSREGQFCSCRCRNDSIRKRAPKQLGLFDPQLSKNLQGTET